MNQLDSLECDRRCLRFQFGSGPFYRTCLKECPVAQLRLTRMVQQRYRDIPTLHIAGNDLLIPDPQIVNVRQPTLQNDLRRKLVRPCKLDLISVNAAFAESLDLGFDIKTTHLRKTRNGHVGYLDAEVECEVRIFRSSGGMNAAPKVVFGIRIAHLLAIQREFRFRILGLSVRIQPVDDFRDFVDPASPLEMIKVHDLFVRPVKMVCHVSYLLEQPLRGIA